MIGLTIKTQNKWGSLFNDIFYGINLNGYFWNVVYDDILQYEDQKSEQGPIFRTNNLKHNDFLECLAVVNYYLIFFLDIKLFPNGSNATEIKEYNDYLKSDCIMIFLCYDSIFIDLYCKDEKILKQIYDNCKNSNDISIVEEVTEKNDTRIRMCVC